MSLSLNPRLSLAQSFVTKGGVACDVGTDHAYLACSLVLDGISKSVYACDVAKGPLESAANTIKRLSLEDKVKTVLSDGLDNVPTDGVTDVIICGMGGELIEKIVLRAEWLKNGVNLVLQPQSKADELRLALYKNGFEIRQEKACRDREFVYTVMQVAYTGNVCELDNTRAYVGKLDLSDSCSREYVDNIVCKLTASSKGKLSSNNEAVRSQGKSEHAIAEELSRLLDERR